MMSIRFPHAVAERLRERAKALGDTASGLAARLVDEGLRMQRHPGIVFRFGPTGRRASLLVGPDIWEIVSVLRHIEARGEEAIAEAASWLNLTPAKIRVALSYYGEFPEEIDERIEANYRAYDEGRAAWEAQQRLLA